MRVHLKSVLYVTVLCVSLVVCFIVLPRPQPRQMQLRVGNYSNSGRRIRRADGIAIAGRGFKVQNLAKKLNDESFRRANPRLEKFVKSHDAYIHNKKPKNKDPPAQIQNVEIKLWEDERNPNNPKPKKPKFKLDKKNSFNDGLIKRGKRSLVGLDSAHKVVTPKRRDVYPTKERYDDDRIVAQLNFVPESVRKAREEGREVPVKKIQLMHSLQTWHVRKGKRVFTEKDCAVKECEILDIRGGFRTADVVVFDTLSFASIARPVGQVWAVYLLESPYATVTSKGGNSNTIGGAIFNWTASFRHDSTLVTPYEKFVLFDPAVRSLPLLKSYAEGKTKKVAWFVSNCNAANNRLEYALELGNYIQVDIYGLCGPLKCNPAQACFNMLSRDYKFYLSFENANCRDYITEKFFINGLQNDVIPIVMGAAPDDYRRAAPHNSFIHVDDFDSVQSLAKRLIELDNNDALYNDYFRWKGTGSFVDTKFWCRMCALAHDVDARGSSWYNNSKNWWDNRLENVCIDRHSWRDFKPGKIIGDLPVVRPGKPPDNSEHKVL